jgi:hypothetical protein
VQVTKILTSSYIYTFLKPCHSSGGHSPASHYGDPVSTPVQVIWDLWWTKWHWGSFPWVFRFPLPIFIPSNAPYSSIIRGLYNRPISGRRTKWTLSHPTSWNLEKIHISISWYIPAMLRTSLIKQVRILQCMDLGLFASRAVFSFQITYDSILQKVG